MKSIAAFALTGAASLLAKGSQYARALLHPLDGRVDQNTADYYVGYRGSDFDQPWAKYFNDSQITLSQAFVDGLEQSPLSPQLGLPFHGAGKALDQPGYLPVENGYTIMEDGTMVLAILSDVPANFSGEMYDFWFSWHINDTTKYKLWNPGQHQYAAVTEQEIQAQHAQSGYRQKYWNITSFVDEYIGDTAYKLSIGFFDPTVLGFSLENAATNVETIVTAFVQIFIYNQEDPASMAKQGFTPLDVVLAHQVRQRPDGNGYEIRSRFWFGSLLVAGMRPIMNPYQLAHDLSVHCANEMTHLGTYLPALFAEFKDNISTK